MRRGVAEETATTLNVRDGYKSERPSAGSGRPGPDVGLQESQK